MALNTKSELPTSTLRPPLDVMTLDRLGSFHQTRLSFVRSLLRKVMREEWEIERAHWEINDEGYGTCVYTVMAPHDEVYSVVFFSHYLPDDRRTDRVIAEEWDVTFVLCEGVVNEEQIADLEKNVPKQEIGRYLPYVLVLSRANKSTRNFSHILDCLARGEQPDVQQLARVGYIYRTTAVYGNGKFGIADYHKLQSTHAFGATFRAQMFTVWMLRDFALEQIHYLARLRNPAAATLHPDLQRYMGVGNATGLGMAPFLVTHPHLIGQWIVTRESAIARVLHEGVVSDAKLARFEQLLDRAIQHLREIETVHPLQQSKNERMFVELQGLREQGTRGYDSWEPLVALVAEMSHETQEVVNSILLELYPDLVDEFADSMDADEDSDLQPEMPLPELCGLIEQEYGWALAIDFAKRENEQWFWYRSAEKEEPRFGNRWEDIGAEKEQPLDIARSVVQLYQRAKHHQAASVIDFLLDYPQLRGVVRRVQAIRNSPYGEIRDNLIGRDCLPIHLLRCKLSFFGASKFDPRSNLWVRITLFQGAPLVSDIGKPFVDDWFWPVAPRELSHNPNHQPTDAKESPVNKLAVEGSTNGAVRAPLPQLKNERALIVSHNEIAMLCRKLFEALGFAQGDYEDSGDMIAWCELYGLPVLGTIHRDLPLFDNENPYQKRLTVRNQQPALTEFDAQGQSCLLVGTLAADWGARTALREGVASVSLQNCRHQALLLPYLLRVAQRGVNLLATWNENDGLTQITAVISANTPHPTLYRQHLSASDHIPNRETNWLHLNYSSHEPLRFSPEMTNEVEVVSSADFSAHFAHHRENGIAVDADIWAELVEVSKGVFVEAIEKSRQFGAGEQIFD